MELSLWELSTNVTEIQSVISRRFCLLRKANSSPVRFTNSQLGKPKWQGSFNKWTDRQRESPRTTCLRIPSKKNSSKRSKVNLMEEIIQNSYFSSEKAEERTFQFQEQPDIRMKKQHCRIAGYRKEKVRTQWLVGKSREAFAERCRYFCELLSSSFTRGINCFHLWFADRKMNPVNIQHPKTQELALQRTHSHSGETARCSEQNKLGSVA